MKRSIPVLLVLVMIISIIAGCSSGTTQTDNNKTPANTSTPTATAAAEEPAAVNLDSFSGKVEISLPAGDFQTYLAKYAKPKFEKRYKNVKLNITLDGGNGGEKLLARVAAGDSPEIYDGTLGYMPAKFHQLGKTVNIKELPGAQELIDRIDPQYISEIDGGLYYVPWTGVTQVMVYNKELFKEAGLDPEKPPVTFDEFLQYADQIQKLPPRANGDKVYGTVFWNDALGWGGWYWQMLAQIYYNFNDGQYQLLNKTGTDIVFDKPEAKMKEFFEFMKKSQGYSPKLMSNKERFFNRNVGMWLQFGLGWKSNFKEAPDKPMVIGEDVGIAPLLVLSADKKPISTLDGRSLLIFKKDDNQVKLAWEVVKFLMEDDNNLDACNVAVQLPTLKSLQKDPLFQEPEYKIFVDQMNNSLINEPFLSAEAVANEVQKAYQKIVVDQSVSVDDGIKEAATAAREALKKAQQ